MIVNNCFITSFRNYVAGECWDLLILRSESNLDIGQNERRGTKQSTFFLNWFIHIYVTISVIVRVVSG